jgi:hypothetical protein
VLPWSSFWEQNYFALGWPGVHAVITNNFVRGAVTGLGVVNLVAGFADLLHLFVGREDRPMSDETASRTP